MDQLINTTNFGEKVASVCSKLRAMIHKRHKFNTNAFLLAIVATPVNSAHSMRNACRPRSRAQLVLRMGQDRRKFNNAHDILFGC